MTLIELQVTVEKFAARPCAEDVKRVVRHLRQRAEICVRKRGSQFKIHEGYLNASQVYIISHDFLFHSGINNSFVMCMT